MRTTGYFLMIVLAFVFMPSGCKDEATLPNQPPADPVELQPPVLSEADGMCEAPHGGTLFPVCGELGYIEWDTLGGHLFVLNQSCQPGLPITHPALFAETSAGPQEIVLRTCDDLPACWTAAEGQLANAELTGVLRFKTPQGHCRVLLSRSPSGMPSTQPQPASLSRPSP